MVMKILVTAITGLVIIHGLIHLIGFRVYGQGGQVSDMPFKTTFLNGSLDFGVSGTRIYGYLWLLPALGFILAAVGFILRIEGWQPVLIAASVVSIVLTSLDWRNAFLGTLIDLALMGIAWFHPFADRFGITF